MNLKKHATSARTTARSITPRTWYTTALLLTLYTLPVVLFAWLAHEVVQKETLRFDESVLLAVRGVSRAWLDPIIVFITNIGGVVGATLLTTGIALWFLAKGQRKNFFIVAAGVGGATLLNIVLKGFFQRDRPQLWERIVTENHYSFPSGHAMASSALVFCLIVILWPTRWRWLAVGVGLTYMLAIAFTRLYLGVHYPTDIMAGWVASLFWVVLLCTYVYGRRGIKKSQI